MEERRKIILFDPKPLHDPIRRHAAHLHEQLRRLGAKPAIFPAILAKIYQRVNDLRTSTVYADELYELCTLLPDIEQENPDQLPIVSACNLFTEEQTRALLAADKLDSQSMLLWPINAQIERLVRIIDEISDDMLAKLVFQIIEYYENFRDALCENGADRASQLEPVAIICGVDLDFYEIPYHLALELICRDPQGRVVKKNKFGQHPSTRIDEIYCKPNLIGDDFFNNGEENFVIIFLQLLNKKFRVAVPVSLYVVSQVKFIKTEAFDMKNEPLLEYENTRAYMRRMGQAASLSQGVLFQIVLETIDVMNQWKAAFKEEYLADLLRDPKKLENLVQLIEKSGLVKNTPDEALQYLSLSADEIQSLIEKLSKIDSSSRELIEYLKIVHDMHEYFNAMPTLIKNYSPQAAINEIPHLLKKIDPYSLCAAVLGYLLLNPTDMKADNFMLCINVNPESGEWEYYFESVDSDRTFSVPFVHRKAGHFLVLHCILLLLDLKIPFDKMLREELLKQPAIYTILSGLQLVDEGEERFLARVIQRAFSEKKDLFENGVPTVDRPSRYNSISLKRMLILFQSAQNILSGNEDITLADFALQLCPIVARYYNTIGAEFGSNYLAAYGSIKRGPTLEKVFVDDFPQDLAEHSCTEVEYNKKTMTGRQACADLLVTYEHRGDLDEHFRFLDYMGTFDYIRKTGYSPDQINGFMMEAAHYLLPNALSFLLRCGADVNCMNAKGETTLHRVFRCANLDKIEESLPFLDLLLQHPLVNVHVVSKEGRTPLMEFISNANHFSAEFIEAVVKRFVSKRTDFNQLTRVGCLLDIAVQLESVALFSVLVSHGAYTFKRPGDGVLFALKNYRDERMVAAIERLSVYNTNFHYKLALSLASFAEAVGKANTPMRGVFNGDRYFKEEVKLQLFNARGDFKSETASRLIEITVFNKVQLYAIGDPDFPDSKVVVSRFYRVFGVTAPYIELFQCVNSQRDFYPVLLTEALDAKRWTAVLQTEGLKKEVLDNLDRHHLTKLLFVQFLMGQVKGSEDNISVLPAFTQEGKRYILSCAPNDAAFSPHVQGHENVESDALFPQLHAFLSLPWDPKAIGDLLSINGYEVLKELLKMLVKYAKNKEKMSLGDSSEMGLAFCEGTMRALFVRIKAFQEILRKNSNNPSFNGWDFLRFAGPLLIPASKESSPQEAPVAPRKTSFLKSLSPRRKASNVPKQDQSVAVEATSSIPLPTKEALSASQRELDEIEGLHQLIDKAVDELVRGGNSTHNSGETTDADAKVSFPIFYSLSLDRFKQDAFNKIDWSKIKSAAGAEKILSMISEAKIHFTAISIIGCPVSIGSFLKKILKRSSGLRHFNVTGCFGMDSKLFRQIEKYCQNIEIVIFNRTRLSSITIGNLRYLTVVHAAECPNLLEVFINSPAVSELDFHASPITDLKLHKEAKNIVSLNVIGCTAINTDDLLQIVSSNHSLTDYQHTGVKEFDMSSYVQCALMNKLILPKVSRSLIQNGVLNLYGAPIQDEQLRRIIDHLTNSQYGHLHKEQILVTLDIRGCQFISRAFIAGIIATVPTLEKVVFQREFSPLKEDPIFLRGLRANRIKTLLLHTGLILFIYDNGQYQVLDNVSLKFIRQGNLHPKLTDADVLPNGDVLACCDGHLYTLDTLTWKFSVLDKAIVGLENKLVFVKVIGAQWLALGGKNLSIVEITPKTFVLEKVKLDVDIRAMVVTPNQKGFVAQSFSHGAIYWRVGAPTMEIFRVEEPSKITSLHAVNNSTILLSGLNLEAPLFLNLQSKAKRVTVAKLHSPTVGFCAVFPGGGLIVGGPQCDSLVLFDRRTDTPKLSFRLQEQQHGYKVRQSDHPVWVDPCITRQGDLLIGSGESTQLIKNQFQVLVLSFYRHLPTSLEVQLLRTENGEICLKLEHTAEISKVERLAMSNLSDFIDDFFGKGKCTILPDSNALLIINIPREELCSFQLMFKSFITRAANHQQSLVSPRPLSTSPRANSQPSPRLYSSQLSFTRRIGSVKTLPKQDDSNNGHDHDTYSPN